MRRGRLLMLIVGITAVAVLMMAMSDGLEKPVQAQTVQVTRGDVTQIAALSGRVAYTDETLVYAAAPGIVSEVLVKEGERVAQGQALVRLDTAGYDRAVSAWLQAGENLGMSGAEDASLLLEGTVIRAPENATVRQIMTYRSAAVTAGVPVALLSSTQRVILCSAVEADVRDIRVGMAARLYVEGAEKGSAVVQRIGELTAEPLTGRLTAQVTLLPDAPLELPAGTAVDADILLAQSTNVPVLPVEAMTERGTVWWVCDGRCTEIPVEVVQHDEMRAWVKLPEGLCVAVGEYTEGQRVEVAP